MRPEAELTLVRGEEVDESGNDAPVPAPKPANGQMKYVAVAAFCLVALLVGVATVSSGSGRKVDAPALETWTGFTGLSSEHKFIHMKKKCVKALMKLEKKYKLKGKKHEAGFGEDVSCDSEHQKCEATVDLPDGAQTMTKCFPTVCEKDNIEKELNALPKLPHQP